MPRTRHEQFYQIEVFIKGSWRPMTDETASLGFAEKQYWDFVERYGEDNVRCIKDLRIRETVDFQKGVK